eukprot:m.179529 g.179529  ORF g.179529 m.179529 type:complete len:55 (-) comp17993_c0_seq1:99-263(-)
MVALPAACVYAMADAGLQAKGHAVIDGLNIGHWERRLFAADQLKAACDHFEVLQ